MYKEKHVIKKVYSNHKLSRYVDVYEVNTINCSASSPTGYSGSTVTITATPLWNQKASAYSITGSTFTGNDFEFVNSDVTAECRYETAKNLTLQTDGHGTIASNRMSGFIGDGVTLSNTPNAGFIFNNYNITGATLTGSNFNFVGNDVTAKANFTMTSFVPTGSMGVYYDNDQNTHVVTNLYTSGVGASVVAHIGSVYNWPSTAKYAAASWHTSSYSLGTGQTGPRVGVATTGSPSPSFSYYNIATNRNTYGPKLVSVIIDDTNHRLSGFIDRSLVMTAGNVPQPRYFNAGFTGWSCIMSGITMRTFDTYGDAYNFVQMWP